MTAPPPLSPSWVDRMQARIDRLPGPAWAFYVIAWLAAAAAVNVVPWAEGVVPVGTLDPYVNSGALYLVFGFTAVHVLDGVAWRAWWTFRVTTDLDDDQARQRAVQLTTMPARPVLAWTGVGLFVGTLYVINQYGQPLDLAEEPVTLVLSVPFVLIGFVGTAVFLYHTLRQLREIGAAHLDVRSVDLLYPGPLNAFGGLTAATGLSLLVIGYAALPTNPNFAGNVTTVVMAAVALVLAVASFVVPLRGIHDLLVAEQGRRLEVVSRLVDTVTGRVHERAGSGDLVDADGLHTQLSSLLAERDVLTRSPTWPWTSGVARAFVTAVILPVALWLLFRVLERTLS